MRVKELPTLNNVYLYLYLTAQQQLGFEPGDHWLTNYAFKSLPNPSTFASIPWSALYELRTASDQKGATTEDDRNRRWQP